MYASYMHMQSFQHREGCKSPFQGPNASGERQDHGGGSKNQGPAFESPPHQDYSISGSIFGIPYLLLVETTICYLLLYWVKQRMRTEPATRTVRAGQKRTSYKETLDRFLRCMRSAANPAECCSGQKQRQFWSLQCLAHCDVMVVWRPALPHKLLRKQAGVLKTCAEAAAVVKLETKAFRASRGPWSTSSRALSDERDGRDNLLLHINPGIARDLDMNTTNQAQRRLCVQSSGMIGFYGGYTGIIGCIYIYIYIYRGYIRIMENGNC